MKELSGSAISAIDKIMAALDELSTEDKTSVLLELIDYNINLKKHSERKAWVMDIEITFNEEPVWIEQREQNLEGLD
jgi:hypothetical protein